MADLFTTVVVCLAAVGAPDDLVRCKHGIMVDDGGYSVGKGYTLKKCNERLPYIHLPGRTFRFCVPSPLRKEQIDGFVTQDDPPP
jgi:hypothetical protein